MSESAPRRRALIVGIDTYVPPGHTGTWSPPATRSGRKAGRTLFADLAGSAHDARAVRQALLDRFGFRPEEIRLLLDREATRDAILAGLAELRDGAGQEDEVFFFFAGHGSQVPNSLSDEADKLDETLVPADSVSGALDLRDKELRRLANQILDRGARLTVVLDSCHSGSALRGLHVPGSRTRQLLEDPRDAADAEPCGPRPEDRGALVLSATQDDQAAREVVGPDGRWGGVFTRALRDAVAAAGPRESVERLFLRAKGRMLAGRAPQEPVLAGVRERRRAPLLRPPERRPAPQQAAARPVRALGGGAGSPEVSGAGYDGWSDRPPADAASRLMYGPAVSVEPGAASEQAPEMAGAAFLCAWPNGTVVLVGGLAAGLQPGCELTSVEAGVRVRVTTANEPGRAEAEVIEGDPGSLAAGALFELSGWAIVGEPSLRVWIPAHPGPWAEVESWARELAHAAAAAGVSWIEDPVAAAPAQVLSWTGEGWRLSAADGRTWDFESRPRPAEALDRILRLAAEAPGRGIAEPTMGGRPEGLFIHLPAPAELARALRLGQDSANDTVERAADPARVSYQLAGRLRRSGDVDFAWVRPGGAAGDRLALPARTDWLPLPRSGGRGGGPAVIHDGLEKAALRLARLRSWLTLEPPPSPPERSFPYRLVLRPAGGGEDRVGGELRAGERLGLVLRAAPEDLQTWFPRRYVYVFLLDSWGRTALFFPPSAQGGVENRFPLERRGRADWPTEIPLGEQPSFDIREPFGADTYFLLTSSEPIPAPHVLECEGVRTRGPKGRTPLEELLSVRGGTRRSGPLLVPADWSLERLTFVSKP